MLIISKCFRNINPPSCQLIFNLFSCSSEIFLPVFFLILPITSLTFLCTKAVMFVLIFFYFFTSIVDPGLLGYPAFFRIFLLIPRYIAGSLSSTFRPFCITSRISSVIHTFFLCRLPGFTRSSQTLMVQSDGVPRVFY